MRMRELQRRINAYRRERFDVCNREESNRWRFFVQNPEALEAIIDDLLILDKAEHEIAEGPLDYCGALLLAANQLITAKVVWTIGHEGRKKKENRKKP